MAKIKLKFVQAFTDRHGQMRYYFRRKGARTPLPGRPGSKEFMAAYATALEGTPKAARKGTVVEGTFDDLINRYYASPRYTELRGITQSNYRRVIERVREHKTKTGVRVGSLTVAGIRREHIVALIEQLAPTPGAAYSLRKMLRLLMTVAVDFGMRQDNPGRGMRRVGKRTAAGYRTVTQEDIAKFRKHFPLGTKARLALELLYNTAARRADVVTFGRQHISGGVLTYATSKTGTVICIPVMPELREAIDAMPASNLTFLVTEYGAPFTPQGFTNWFKAKCKDAGLPAASSPHGLRKAFLTHLANNGATTAEMKSWSGHVHTQELDTYTRQVDRRRLAQDAMRKLQEQKVSNPDDRVANSGEKP